MRGRLKHFSIKLLQNPKAVELYFDTCMGALL